MNRGCSIGLMIALVIAGVVGYIGYRFANQFAELPEEIAPYQHLDSVRSMVASAAPRPSDSARLTEAWVSPLLAAADASNAIVGQIASNIAALKKEDGGFIKNFGAGMNLVKEARLIPLLVRRGVVQILNQQNRSWAEYDWAKERAIAAAGITRSNVDSAAQALFHATLGDTTDAQIRVPDGAVGDFYRRTDSLRASGAIDSAEFALMRPYRQLLLDRGVLLLLGIEAHDSFDVIVSE